MGKPKNPKKSQHNQKQLLLAKTQVMKDYHQRHKNKDMLYNLAHSLFELMELTFTNDSPQSRQFFFYLSQVIAYIADMYQGEDKDETLKFRDQVQQKISNPLFYYYLPHDCKTTHSTPSTHKENPRRLRDLEKIFQKMGITSPILSESMSMKTLTPKLHDTRYLHKMMRQKSEEDLYPHFQDHPHVYPGDNLWRHDTQLAINASLGAMNDAVQRTLKNINDKHAENLFLAIRPPSHHAHHDHPEGFCFVSTLVDAALKLMGAKKKVLIIDIDLHHGNGTYAQLKKWHAKYINNYRFIDIYCNETYISNTPSAAEKKFQDHMKLYPMKKGYTGQALLQKINEALNQLGAFQPDVVLVSAGFDAVAEEGFNGGLSVEDYGPIGERLASICPHMISFLEGGYHKDYLHKSVYYYLTGSHSLLINEANVPFPGQKQEALEFVARRLLPEIDSAKFTF